MWHSAGWEKGEPYAVYPSYTTGEYYLTLTATDWSGTSSATGEERVVR